LSEHERTGQLIEATYTGMHHLVVLAGAALRRLGQAGPFAERIARLILTESRRMAPDVNCSFLGSYLSTLDPAQHCPLLDELSEFLASRITDAFHAPLSSLQSSQSEALEDPIGLLKNIVAAFSESGHLSIAAAFISRFEGDVIAGLGKKPFALISRL